MKKGFVSLSTLAVLAIPAAVSAQQPAPAEPAEAAPQPAPVIGGPGSAAPAAADPTAPAPAAGAAAAPDKPAAPPAGDKEPEPLIWRGTTFTWTTAATTTMLGVGRDNIGVEEDYFGMDWVVAPNLYLLDLPNDKITVFAEAGVTLEITDSGTTTTQKEPQFRDTQLGVGYSRNIYTTDDKEWSTKGSARVRAVFPSSPMSYNQGKYLTSSLALSLSQQIRLLGKDADGLNNLLVAAGFTWSHLFSRATTPTNPDLQRERMSASGQSFDSDQLTYGSFDIDRVIPSLTVTLPIYKGLELATQFRLIGRFTHSPEGQDCVDILTGPACQDGDVSNDIEYKTSSTFDIALSMPVYDVVSLNVGYNNEALTLGEDGKNRNIFYSPGAQFYLDLVANIDVIYSKASGREEFELPPTPGRSSTALNANGMPSF